MCNNNSYLIALQNLKNIKRILQKKKFEYCGLPSHLPAVHIFGCSFEMCVYFFSGSYSFQSGFTNTKQIMRFFHPPFLNVVHFA